MHSKSDLAILDIIHHGKLAIVFAANHAYEQKTVFAVIRCLEVISEASRHVSPDVKARHNGIAWQETLRLATSIAINMKTSLHTRFGLHFVMRCLHYSAR